ncbi:MULTISPECIES: SRPBCC family protein [Streptomyces]|uniref:SRPBCC family protein n=1 Tax=Streptomyces TaxID=1883 RepID=UPI0029A482EC|nr:SRPBCC family protein [Streptomyces sp. WI03-4A]MDX2597511.1 SRPBCC family protein [Streptomyces sp. WI03-4A]
MTVDLTGTFLTLDGGRPAVRFSRVHDRPVERVWRFVTEPGELARWFPSRAEMDLRPGGVVRFSGDPNMPESAGRVIDVRPPLHLSLEWGGDELHFDLEELGARKDTGGARTRFTLTDVLAAEDTAARNAAGWEVCLAALDTAAGGGPPAGERTGAGGTWQEFYAAYVTAGVPSGAPVPGPDRPPAGR